MSSTEHVEAILYRWQDGFWWELEKLEAWLRERT